MKNLLELWEKYKDKPNGFGYLGWGTKYFYEINSNEPLNLNRYGGNGGFILNKKGEVEISKILGSIKCWGKTLDNYYPHPWYPEKNIVAIEIVRDIPFASTGMNYEIFDEDIAKDWRGMIRCGYTDYSVEDCLQYPEFFKPVYEYDFSLYKQYND